MAKRIRRRNDHYDVLRERVGASGYEQQAERRRVARLYGGRVSATLATREQNYTGRRVSCGKYA